MRSAYPQQRHKSAIALPTLVSQLDINSLYDRREAAELLARNLKWSALLLLFLTKILNLLGV